MKYIFIISLIFTTYQSTASISFGGGIYQYPIKMFNQLSSNTTLFIWLGDVTFLDHDFTKEAIHNKYLATYQDIYYSTIRKYSYITGVWHKNDYQLDFISKHHPWKNVIKDQFCLFLNDPSIFPDSFNMGRSQYLVFSNNQVTLYNQYERQVDDEGIIKIIMLDWNSNEEQINFLQYEMHSRQKIDLYLIISSVEINDGTPNEIVKLKKKLIQFAIDYNAAVIIISKNTNQPKIIQLSHNPQVIEISTTQLTSETDVISQLKDLFSININSIGSLDIDFDWNDQLSSLITIKIKSIDDVLLQYTTTFKELQYNRQLQYNQVQPIELNVNKQFQYSFLIKSIFTIGVISIAFTFTYFKGNKKFEIK